MRKILSIVASMATAFVYVMCSNNGNIPIETNWEVEYICSDNKEMAPPADHQATLAFLGDSKISGTTGCNRFFGEFSVKGENLNFDNVGSTRMMCPDMAFETAFIDAVAKTCTFTINGDHLTLKDNSGNIVALLKKIEPIALEN